MNTWIELAIMACINSVHVCPALIPTPAIMPVKDREALVALEDAVKIRNEKIHPIWTEQTIAQIASRQRNLKEQLAQELSANAGPCSALELAGQRGACTRFLIDSVDKGRIDVVVNAIVNSHSDIHAPEAMAGFAYTLAGTIDTVVAFKKLKIDSPITHEWANFLLADLALPFVRQFQPEEVMRQLPNGAQNWGEHMINTAVSKICNSGLKEQLPDDANDGMPLNLDYCDADDEHGR